MSYINNFNVKYADSPNMDAFQRLRVSEGVTLFDSKFLRDTGSINWNTLITNNATASFWSSSVLLLASSSVAAPASVIRQSRRRFNYQSGKSNLAICTANFVAQDVNTIKRVGYFDQNNGVYFVYTGSQFGVGYRNNGNDIFISQSAWNMDTYNGLGASGNSLNITASQIYFTDLEWLGVGRVRWGIFQGGIPTYVHQLTNINALPYTNPVYIASPNNPIRYELINSGSVTSSFVQICSTVISEGGIQLTGPTLGVDNGAFPAYVASGSYNAVLALQYQTSSFLNETIIPQHLSIVCPNTTAILKWSLLLNPNITGSALTYSVVPNSTLQYSTCSINNTILNEGTKISSGYTNAYYPEILISYDPSLGIGSSVTGSISDTLVLAVANYTSGSTANTASIFASITWQETI